MKGLLSSASICHGEAVISCCTTQLFLQAWLPCSVALLPLTITIVPHKWKPGQQSTHSYSTSKASLRNHFGIASPAGNLLELGFSFLEHEKLWQSCSCSLGAQLIENIPRQAEKTTWYPPHFLSTLQKMAERRYTTATWAICKCSILSVLKVHQLPQSSFRHHKLHEG